MTSFEKYQLRSVQTRGMVLNLCTLLERQLEALLSKYFCKDEPHQRELIERIFGTERVSLKSKYHIILDLLKDQFETSEEYTVEFKGLQTRFDDFARIRNCFAHDADLVGEGMVPDVVYDKYDICLVSMKDIKKTKFYTSDEVVNIIEDINKLQAELMDKIYPKIFKDG